MEFLSSFLPIVIYFLLIIFLIVGIILGIRLLLTIEKIEKVIEDVNSKMESLNGFFHIIDYTTDSIAFVTDKVVDGVNNLVKKLFFRKKKESKNNE